MADSKISALPASTTPLAGTEVLPIVQSSTTKQVSVANLTAGRAVSASSLTASTGDITSTAGNFVVGTSGKGVDFSVTSQAGGMTSELLADYEEGTWTPVVAVNSGTATGYTIEKSVYTKIGREVTAKTEISPTGGTFGNSVGYCQVNGLPFQPSGNFAGSMGNSANYILNEAALAFTNSVNTNIGIMAGILISVGNRATLQVTYFV